MVTLRYQLLLESTIEITVSIGLIPRIRLAVFKAMEIPLELQLAILAPVLQGEREDSFHM